MIKRTDWRKHKHEILNDSFGDVRYIGIIVVDLELGCHTPWKNDLEYNCFRPSYPITDIR